MIRSAPPVPPAPPLPGADDHWMPTGCIIARPWWFGIMVILVEERRKLPRSAFPGGADLGWELRWRRAKRGEVTARVTVWNGQA